MVLMFGHDFCHPCNNDVHEKLGCAETSVHSPNVPILFISMHTGSHWLTISMEMVRC